MGAHEDLACVQGRQYDPRVPAGGYQLADVLLAQQSQLYSSGRDGSWQDHSVVDVLPGDGQLWGPRALSDSGAAVYDRQLDS